MSRLKLENLFADDEILDPTAFPDYTTLHFVSNGSHIYGEIMWPSSNIEKPHPCVIMLHGFPAWGSEGKYTITHCIEKPRSVPVFPRSKTFVLDLKLMMLGLSPFFTPIHKKNVPPTLHKEV